MFKKFLTKILRTFFLELCLPLEYFDIRPTPASFSFIFAILNHMIIGNLKQHSMLGRALGYEPTTFRSRDYCHNL